MVRPWAEPLRPRASELHLHRPLFFFFFFLIQYSRAGYTYGEAPPPTETPVNTRFWDPTDGGLPRTTSPSNPHRPALFIDPNRILSILTDLFDANSSHSHLPHSLLPLPFSSFTLLTFLHRNTTWSGVCSSSPSSANLSSSYLSSPNPTGNMFPSFDGSSAVPKNEPNCYPCGWRHPPLRPYNSPCRMQ